MRYRPAVDGLRGVAIGLVVWYHAAFRTGHELSGGFLGVNVFFVISGYLITTLLVREWQATEHISQAEFYRRRALRLLPALAGLVVLAVALQIGVGPVTTLPLWGSVLALALFASNWVTMIRLDAPAGYLGHTWSLAVEEQFYLVWPLVLRRLLPRVATVRLAGCALAGALLVMAARAGLWSALVAPRRHHVDPNVYRYFYFNTLLQADGLLLGVALALWLVGRPDVGPDHAGRLRDVLVAVVGAGLIGWAAWTSQLLGDTTYQWGFSGASVGAVLLLHHVVTRPGSAVSRLLACPPLRVLGLLSYSLYLVHVPIIEAFQHRGVSPRDTLLGAVPLSLAAAALSYLLIERPFLRRKRRHTAPTPAAS